MKSGSKLRRARWRRGTVHYVPADFATLAEALASDSVVDGDVIQLAQGYHAPTTSASTNYLGEIAKAVTVRGDECNISTSGLLLFCRWSLPKAPSGDLRKVNNLPNGKTHRKVYS